MTDRKPIAAAVKLARDAEAAGLLTRTFRTPDDVFLVVTVTNPGTRRGIVAEWWDGSLVREFNYAEVREIVGDRVKSRRASSLKAARAHVGL